MRLAFVVLVFLGFTIWSAVTIAEPGLGGLVSLLRTEPWAAQMFVDLIISCSVAWSWLAPDAKRHGIGAWPYIAGTVALGSISILAYLVHREIVRLRRPLTPAAA